MSYSQSEERKKTEARSKQRREKDEKKIEIEVIARERPNESLLWEHKKWDIACSKDQFSQ